jgi:hypothetical protein
MDLFAHELTRLGGCALACPLVLPGAPQGLLLWHSAFLLSVELAKFGLGALEHALTRRARHGC